MKILIMLIFSFCVMHFTGCTKSKEKDSGNVPQNQGEVSQKDGLNSAGVKEGGHEFTVRYPAQRRIYKLEKEDLNDDGTKEIIVLSVALDTSDKYSDYYNFDMIEVFALNMDKNSYVKILSDTVDYSEECSFVDLANDKKKQILISTNSGGNDDIVSDGMFIYDMTSKDTIKLLKYFDSGAPEVRDIKKDGTNEILVSDLFYGVMPQKEAVNFVKGIYKLENQDLVEKNSEYKEFFDEQIIRAKDNYYGLKRKMEMGMQPMNLSYPLYREAAIVIINYYSKGDEINLKKFWDEETEYLKKNIPENEYMDLNNFITKALPIAENA